MPFDTFTDANFIASLLFVFAISYALLVKAKVIDIKGANAAIALAIGFFAASYAPLQQFLQSILPVAAILLVVGFFVEFARTLGGKGPDKLPATVGLVVSLMLLAVLWNRIAAQLPPGVDPASVLWILGTAIILMIFYLVYQHKPPHQ